MKKHLLSIAALSLLAAAAAVSQLERVERELDHELA